MIRPRQPLGYTIVEIMIVLAVSGVMFLIAASFINGKQARAAFSTSTNQMASMLQGVIEQVTDGQYSDIPVTCTPHPGTIPTFSTNASGTALNSVQGSNAPCIFVGKLLYFQQGTSPTYYTFSLAGNRLNADNSPAVDFAHTFPTPVYGGGVDLTAQANTPQNLMILGIKVDGAAAYDFGFSQGLGSLDVTDVTGNTLATGAQTAGIFYTTTLTAAGLSSPSLISTYLQNAASAATYHYASTASICVTDGTRFATIDVGKSSGNQLTATATIIPSAASC